MTSSSPWRSDFGIFKNKPITNHYKSKIKLITEKIDKFKLSKTIY